MEKKYHYIRWRWGDKIDVDKLANELSKEYDVNSIQDYGWELELTYQKENRDKYMIKSDTLTVFLSLFRVVMVQKKAAPFTKKDLRLRSRLMELFPKERPTFLPWQFNSEPRFDVVTNSK